MGLRTASGQRIVISKVERILKNPFYYGSMKVKGVLYPHKYDTLISEELFSLVQERLTGRKKAPVHFISKPILLRGLINCDKCGCTVTGDVKKQRYTYYSCNNSKKTCKKIWLREETRLAPLLEHLDRLYLSNQQIMEIVEFLREAHAEDQAFFKHSQEALKRELALLQSRISKLIDCI